MVASRRTLLRAAAVATAGIAMQTGLASPAWSAARAKPILRRAKPLTNPIFSGENSPNGWPINTKSDAGGSVWARPVAGAGTTVEVSIGDVEVILVHVVRRFHYEIDTLRPGEVIGFRKAAGVKGYQLNHASGTAVDIRPGSYPVGVGGGFFPAQLEVIRDILADCEGLVSWGGDFTIPDEAHFQLAVPPSDARVTALAAKLRGWTATPGLGAGVIQNPLDPHRRDAALRVQRRQHH
ncbi:M15 family metallopeptidase [Streptomyces sp. NPDC005492]|uniref:M15 family metallopeptidase n=1 Tax=Streptomyces sp. NPDC005492 TaxID=3156883 RepID=UPI0033B3BAD5